MRVRGVCLRWLLNYTAILMLQLDATVCMFGKRERGLTPWECGTVLPSPRLSPPPSWLPWLRKEAPRGVDILTGWMSGRNYWSLWGARPLVSLRLETCGGSIEAFVKTIQPICFGTSQLLTSCEMTKPPNQSQPSTFPPTSPALAICLWNQPSTQHFKVRVIYLQSSWSWSYTFTCHAASS